MQTFTYAMLCGSSVKIGKSTDVPRRLKEVQTHNPNPVSLGVIAKDAERRIHNVLETRGVRRLSGEWFEYDEEAQTVLRAWGLMGSTPGFASWLVAQAHRDDSVGDLAQDSQRDPNWKTAGQTKAEIKGYLRLRGACREALAAFDRAWREWAEG